LARRADREGTFTYARLVELRRELLTLRRELARKIVGHIDPALDATIEAAQVSSMGAFAEVQEIASKVLPNGPLPVAFNFVDVPVGMLAKVKDVAHDGMSWRAWGARLADGVVRRIESQLRQGAALGETIPDLAKRLTRAGELSRISAERLARTAINATGNRARFEVYRANSGPMGIVRGWRFVATLDGRTSRICGALDQRTFRIDDPEAPKPPRHPNCRSVAVPVTASWEELLGPKGKALDDAPTGERPFVADTRKVKDIPAEERQGAIGQVPGDTSYETWFRRQDRDFQREVLGETRYRAYRRGLPLSAMASYSRELSVAELRRLYPRQMPQEHAA
jgi:SPP1 gp7 family putative phage head morphogenesis protein